MQQCRVCKAAARAHQGRQAAKRQAQVKAQNHAHFHSSVEESELSECELSAAVGGCERRGTHLQGLYPTGGSARCWKNALPYAKPHGVRQC